MKKFLYISAFFPNKYAGHAGGRVAFENLMALRVDGHVDAVVCTSENIIADNAQGIRVIHQGKLSFIQYLVKNFKNLSWHSFLTAPIIHTRLNQNAEYLIIELLKAKDYDEIFIDFTQCLMLVKQALLKSGVRLKITACLHDVFAQRMIRSNLFVDSVLTGIVCKQEQELIKLLDDITVLSIKDKELLQSLYSANSVKIKPFSPPDWCANVNRSAAQINSKKIIFFGNFDRIENSSAAEWFIENAMNEICLAIPDATLILLGTGSDRLAAQIGVSNVVGIGFIEDPSPYFSCCGCAIAPLFQGAGVKFKVLEALACGVPVVGTAVACEGIAPQSMLFQSEVETFAAETIHILQMKKQF
jgi:glycosyltransferase involved in cell wall biosynthesis